MNAKQTATAIVSDNKLEPIGSDKESALRGGKHISVKACVMLFVNGAETKLDQTRAEMFIQMIRASSPEEVKETLRGASEDEKKADPNALPPVVAAMVKEGMQKNSAQARLSQLRTIYNAYKEGELPSKIPTWNKLVALAGIAAEKRKTVKANLRKTKAEKEIADKLAAELGGWTKISAKQHSEIMEQTSKLLESKELESESKREGKAIERNIDSIMEKGEDYANAIMHGLAAKLGYRLSKINRKEYADIVKDSPVIVKEKTATAEEVRH